MYILYTYENFLCVELLEAINCFSPTDIIFIGSPSFSFSYCWRCAYL